MSGGSSDGSRGPWLERFQAYFARPVAEAAAKSLGSGAEVRLAVAGEILTFSREGGRNVVRAGDPADAQVSFTMPAKAAEAILSDPSEDVGQIGVHIAKLL